MHIPGCQKNGTFHTGIQKNRAIHIIFVEKRGPVTYLAALKKGAIRHAHPYYVIHRKLPPPPPRRPPPHPPGLHKSIAGRYRPVRVAIDLCRILVGYHLMIFVNGSDPQNAASDLGPNIYVNYGKGPIQEAQHSPFYSAWRS